MNRIDNLELRIRSNDFRIELDGVEVPPWLSRWDMAVVQAHNATRTKFLSHNQPVGPNSGPRMVAINKDKIQILRN